MKPEIIDRLNEEQWLEERRKHVTATDIGRLANSTYGSATWHTIRAEKQGQRSFTGNAYTEWGKQREPIIMGHLGFTHDVKSNNDLWVAGNYAATPDGYTTDKVVEVKTTGKMWADKHEAFTQYPNYYDQMQWSMMVSGREACLFVWEHRVGSAPMFEPGSLRWELVERDDARIAVLVEVAEQFRKFLDEPVGSSEFDEWMAGYVVARRAQAVANARVAELEAGLRERLGGESTAVDTEFGRISYTWGKPRKTFDSTSFKKQHADLYEQFVVEGKQPEKATLRITLKEE